MGSPPHTRGKEAKFLSTAFNNGITPAHAGKSEVREGGAARGEDHPRTRGEKHGYTARCQFHLGSPPHTRGKEFICKNVDYNCRITPAHAGKSIIKIFYAVIIWDHPRTRGEKFIVYVEVCITLGSPPHTRGKDLSSQSCSITVRITPAHAGKSQSYPLLSALPQDHPRTRGEKHTEMTIKNRNKGSPPHTRGKAGGFFSYDCVLGITPAHAGKRS